METTSSFAVKNNSKSVKNFKPRFIMLGGFLGAGKTTTLLKLALFLQRRGLRVGLITNDQAQGLVDSALAEELNLSVEEIAGGCFCCRSESLVEVLDKLEADSQPHVFLAEPVGSCTDLIATVSLPLERVYNRAFIMAPYTVVVDPYRAMQSLGVEGESLFSPDVNYIYRKQLEEAEIIAINKLDVINSERLAGLRAALEREYPQARIMEIASRSDLGLDKLFAVLAKESCQTRQVIDLDYERYSAGEALLGWLNIQGTLALRKDSSKEIIAFSEAKESVEVVNPPISQTDGNALLMAVAEGIARRLTKRGIEVAHLKLSLASDMDIAVAEEGDKEVKRMESSSEANQDPSKCMVGSEMKIDDESRFESESAVAPSRTCLAAVQWVRNGISPEVTRRMNIPLTGGRLLINLRAEGDPAILAADTFASLTENLETFPEIMMTSLRTEHFRPSKPVPTHRIEVF